LIRDDTANALEFELTPRTI